MRAVDARRAELALGGLRFNLERSAREIETELRRLEAEGASGGRRERLARLLDHEGDVLLRVRRAQARLRDGLYGACTRCSDPMDDELLHAEPEAEECEDCRSALPLAA